MISDKRSDKSDKDGDNVSGDGKGNFRDYIGTGNDEIRTKLN